MNSDVTAVIKRYPEAIGLKILFLRELIYEAADEIKGLGVLEETLKWNEPSYLAKSASTVRIAWRKSYPNQYGMFFNCKTKLVDTYKELYNDIFTFEGNRAIIFNEYDAVAVDELKHCIKLALTYHKRKHLPMLGV